MLSVGALIICDMAKQTYSEKLQDPRWQKKRLEIFQRDDWRCRVCGDTTTTLHVHHKKYSNNKEPWDYPDDNFMTVCSTCHEIITACQAKIRVFDIHKLEAMSSTSEANPDALLKVYNYNKKGITIIVKNPDGAWLIWPLTEEENIKVKKIIQN